MPRIGAAGSLVGMKESVDDTTGVDHDRSGEGRRRGLPRHSSPTDRKELPS